MNEVEVTVTNVIIGGLITVTIGSLLATGYLWRIYLRSDRRSKIFRDWAIISSMIVASGAIIAPPALLALVGAPRLPFTGAIVCLALLIAFSVPVYLASRVRRIRSRASHEDPPREVPPPSEVD